MEPSVRRQAAPYPVAPPHEPPADPVHRRGAHRMALAASTAVVVCGFWLIVAPFALGYRDTAGATNAAFYNDIMVGVALVIMAVPRFIAPLRTAPLSFVNALLGAWLIAAPFALAYEGAGASQATGNDVLVGMAVALFAATSALAPRPRRTPAKR